MSSLHYLFHQKPRLALLPPSLTLSNASFVAGATAGTLVGNILGKTAGTTLSLFPNDGRLAFSGSDGAGWQLLVGAAASTAGDLPIILKELKPDGIHASPFTLMAMAEDRYLFFATRNRVPSGSLVTAASGTNYVMTKIVVNTPQYAVNHLRMHYSGFASSEGGTSPQETVLPGNATLIDGVWISVNDASPVRAKFSGADGFSIASGANGGWIDNLALGVNIPAESRIAIFTLYHTNVGEKQIPVYRVQTHRGERVWGAVDAASLTALLATPNAASTPALDTGFGQTMPQYYGPDIMVAKGWDGRPVALIPDDSIGEARQEFAITADERGNMGYLRRWLDKNGPGYGRIPHGMIGLPGAAAMRELTTSAFARWNVVDEIRAFNGGTKNAWTVLLNQLAQNDTTSTYTATLSRLTGFTSRLRARYSGIKKIDIPPLGRTTSTNLFIDAAGQSYAANNSYPSDGTANSIKYQIIDAEIAGGSAVNDGCIDNRGCWSDPANPGKWITGLFSPVLAVQAGTDGIATYSTITLDRSAIPGDVLAYGSTTLQISSVIGNVATLAVPSATVIPAGTTLYSQASPEGLHPHIRTILYIVNAIPQSEKGKLV